ncbi:MFS transporter [Virgisporangium aliadipatigenens]|uniref:MFS transporter n=1 Tax=Virgisporangium aliadipatigenens TaxID=741659 RepID=A0A8J4DSH2_9ACTN|nr:MFS transporter [Virgisporangium aliadipatigenens]GIJ47878.1 MFS transporter [Virgisporangium aliadipatigenens]
MTAAAVDRRPGNGLLVVTCLATLVVNANTSAVTILLPAIGADLDASMSTLQWAVTGYSLVGAAVIVTAGVLGDIFGRRRLFLCGLWLFVASCVLIALSGNAFGVVAGRMVQGAAGSTLLACGLSLLAAGSSGPPRMRAVSLWGAAAAVGAAVGPLAGGLLVGATGWQGLFWVDAAVALVCVPLTLRAVPESRDPGRARTVDFLGTVLVAAALAALILAVTEGPQWGWASVATLACLAVSAASVVAFISVERRVRAPLVDLSMLANRPLMAATLGILIGSGTVNGLMYLFSVYAQDPATLGMTALEAGVATLPVSLALVVTAPLVTRLGARIGVRTVISLGFLVTTAGFGVLVLTGADWTYAAFVLPLVAAAVGMGFTNGPCSAIATAVVPPDRIGAASGISNMARYVGASVLTAIAATCYASAGGGTADARADGFSRGALAMTLVSAAGIALAAFAGRLRHRHRGTVDDAASAAGSAHTLPVAAGARSG